MDFQICVMMWKAFKNIDTKSKKIYENELLNKLMLKVEINR